MKKLLMLFAGIAVLLGVKFIFFSKQNEPVKTNGPGAQQAIPVSVYVTQTSEIDQEITSTGTLFANEEVVLTPEVSGKITAINFNEGERVSKGQVLVKLNDADLVAQLNKLRVQRKFQFEKAERLKNLLKIQGTSQEEFDQAQSMLDASDADMSYLQSNIAKTEIRAPFSGVIGLRYLSVGAFVNASSRIATLQQNDLLKLDFSIPERYISQFDLPLTIQYKLQGSEISNEAQVYAIEPMVDVNTRTFKMRALVNNASFKILPGQFAQIKLQLNAQNHSILIPTQCIIPTLKGKKVFICKEGKAQEVQVETGFRNDEQIEVLSGLQVGDSVITSGLMSIKPDAALKIIPAKSTQKEAKHE
jgi:membrane fusion protein (multidrug efflux system)